MRVKKAQFSDFRVFPLKRERKKRPVDRVEARCLPRSEQSDCNYMMP